MQAQWPVRGWNGGVEGEVEGDIVMGVVSGVDLGWGVERERLYVLLT